MRRNVTKAVSLLLCLIILTSALMLPAAAYKAPIINPCDSSYVISDLEAMGYNTDDYKYDPSADFLQVIHFLEYGYSKNVSGYYSLYLYLYNPCGRTISLEGSTLQMCYNTGSGDTKYIKYPIEVVSYSLENGEKHVLYKLEVKGIESVRREIKDSSRTYKLASVEILYDGESKPVSRLLDNNSDKNRCRWTYTGYQQGFGSDTEGGTLQVQIDVLDTIPVELHDASWMSDTSNLGEDYRWEVKSYYFNIPDSYIKTYGNISGKNSGLVSVEGEYYKYGVNGLIVPDQATYDAFLPIANRNIGSGTIHDRESFAKLIGIESSGNNVTHTKINYYFSFNEPIGVDLNSGADSLIKYSNKKLIKYCLLSKGTSPYISNTDFASLWERSGKPVLSNASYMYIGDNVTNIGERVSFTVSVTDGDLGGAIKTYASQNKWGKLNWLHRLFNKSLYTDESGYTDCLPLIQVEAADVAEIFKESVQGRVLYLDYGSYTGLQDFYEAMNQSNSVYIMRLGVEPYYETDVSLSTENSGYYYEKVIHKDTDIFAFTFQNTKGEKQTVPVECDPVDNLGSVVEGNNKVDGNPNGYPDDPSAGEIATDLFKDIYNFLSSLKGIVILIGSTIGIVTILVLVVVFWKYLEPWFIRAGKAIGWLGRGLGKIFGIIFRVLGTLFKILLYPLIFIWNIGMTVLSIWFPPASAFRINMSFSSRGSTFSSDKSTYDGDERMLRRNEERRREEHHQADMREAKLKEQKLKTDIEAKKASNPAMIGLEKTYDTDEFFEAALKRSEEEII